MIKKIAQNKKVFSFIQMDIVLHVIIMQTSQKSYGCMAILPSLIIQDNNNTNKHHTAIQQTD